MNILLLCSAGMSTSMMVKKMQDTAAERGLDATIWAVGAGEASNEVPKSDVVLLGPQVRFMLDNIRGIAKDIPVDVIDMMAYGQMDGAKVLDQAIALIK